MKSLFIYFAIIPAMLWNVATGYAQVSDNYSPASDNESAQNSSSQWEFLGPEGSTVLDITIDPNSGAIYLATDDNGAFKSVDGGQSWTKHGTPTYGELYEILIDPHNPDRLYGGFWRGMVRSVNAQIQWDNITFIAIGQIPATAISVDAFDENTLYMASWNAVNKSTDFGVTWSDFSTGLSGNMEEMRVHNATNNLYLSTSEGLFVLYNGATSWTQLISGEYCKFIEIDQSNGNLYIATIDQIYKSSDGGSTWTSDPIPFTTPLAFTIDSSDPNIMYLSWWSDGVQKSTDGGISWSSIGTGLTGDASRVYSIVVDPNDGQTVFAGTYYEGVFKSSDGGVSFNVSNGGNDVHFNEDNSDIVIDYSNSQNLYAVAEEVVNISADGGTSWSSEYISGRTYCITQDPNNPQVMYVGKIGTISKTTDGWITQTSVGDYSLMGNSGEIIVDYTNSDIVYAMSNHGKGIFKSTDEGINWTLMDNGYTAPDAYAWDLVMDAVDPLVLYTILRDPVANVYNVYKTTDGANTWTEMIHDTDLNRLIADPQKEGVIYAVAYNNNSLIKSTDGGLTWTEIYDKGSWHMAINPSNPDQLVIGSSSFFEYSNDGGATWNSLTGGLPTNILITRLVYDQNSPNDLYAMTNHHGIFRLSVPESDPITIDQDPANQNVCAGEPANFSIIASGPNLIYQWQESTDGGAAFNDVIDGGSYSGSTSPDLTIVPTMSSLNDYQYRCVVNGTETSASASLTVSPANFSITSAEVSCSVSSFFVPVVADFDVSAEVLGMDFCLQYDETLMTPTGYAILSDVVHGGDPTYGDYLLNVTTPGTVNGIIYITNAAPFPTFFSGQGTIIEVEFTWTNDFDPGMSSPVSFCGVSESTLSSGNIDHCNLNDGVFSVVNDPSFTGTLKYWDKNGRRLAYDENTPGAYIATYISGVDASCAPSGATTFLPDLNGEFEFLVAEGDHLKIERDIPGDFSNSANCTNIMQWVGGIDQSRAMRIAILDASYVPTAYAIIAADVNQDGIVNAGDVTLIGARSVMSICGFPGPGVERDWLFIDKTTATSDLNYIMSSVFPNDDGVGYSKNNVPGIPECLPTPLTAVDECTTANDEDYIAILLGDVNGNWLQADGSGARGEDELSYDLEGITESNGIYNVPVVLNAPMEVESFDLHFEFSEYEIESVEIVDFPQHFEQVSNVHEQQYLFSSYTLQPETESGQLFQLQIDPSVGTPNPTEFSSMKVYINSNEVSIGGEIAEVVLSIFESESASLRIFPNPVTDYIRIEGIDPAVEFDLTILNTSGQKIINVREHGKAELNVDLRSLTPGLYLMNISFNGNLHTVKIIK